MFRLCGGLKFRDFGHRHARLDCACRAWRMSLHVSSSVWALWRPVHGRSAVFHGSLSTEGSLISGNSLTVSCKSKGMLVKRHCSVRFSSLGKHWEGLTLHSFCDARNAPEAARQTLEMFREGYRHYGRPPRIKFPSASSSHCSLTIQDIPLSVSPQSLTPSITAAHLPDIHKSWTNQKLFLKRYRLCHSSKSNEDTNRCAYTLYDTVASDMCNTTVDAPYRCGCGWGPAMEAADSHRC